MLQPVSATQFMMTPRARLMELIDGYLSTQLIHAAVRLGIPERLAHGARTAGQIGAGLEVDSGRVLRLLRGLATLGIVEEHDDQTFTLTSIGTLLDPNESGSLAGPARVRGELYAPAATYLVDALLSGEVPFERQSGTDFFSFAQQDREACRVFQSSMSARSRFEAAAVVEAYDFSRFRKIVDVGGGLGVLLETILDVIPQANGVIFDLPVVIDIAKDRLADRSAGGRIDVVKGDFFHDRLPGGDCLLLSKILHDWNDDDALLILGAVRDALDPNGVVLIVESVLPERAIDDPVAIRLDLVMLIMLDGRERTLSEYETLLMRAGFKLDAVKNCGPASGVSILEARPR